MAMFDGKSGIEVVESLNSIVKDADTNATAVDSQGFSSIVHVVNVGANGITFSTSNKVDIELEHSDDNSTFTDVAQADIVDGTISSGGIFLKLDGTAGGNPDTAGDIFRVGYRGGKRYIRVVLAKTGTHSNGTPIGAFIVKSHARHTGDNAFTAHAS